MRLGGTKGHNVSDARVDVLAVRPRILVLSAPVGGGHDAAARAVAADLQDLGYDAVVGLDRGKEVRRSAGLIRARRPFDPAALRDEDVDLRKLAAAALAEGKGGNR